MGWTIFILFWLVLALTIFKLYYKLTTGWCRSNVCLVGKTAIITGANIGIGYETAIDFAKRGARVILACRNPIRGKKAEEKIIRETDNKNVVFKKLDLSSFTSIRDFAEDINQTEERLDILVNNAGLVGVGDKTTEDGLSVVMQANHFGHFLLTNLVLDLIKKTGNSRIVNVSSASANYTRGFNVDNLNSYPKGGRFPDMDLYSRSKLCNVLFTIELAEKLKGTKVTTYSVHPGAVRTDVFKSIPPVFKFIAEGAFGIFAKNALEGAQTNIYCSIAKGIEIFSGEHFADCHFERRYKTAEDPDLPKKLWRISEEIVGCNGFNKK